MSIGDKLEVLRKEHKFTQEQVAEMVGVSQVSYRNWEKDIKNPSANNLEKIAKAFHVSTVYLQDDSDAGELINFYKQLQPLRQKLVTAFASKQLKEQDSTSTFVQEEKTYYEVKVFERVSAGLGTGVIGDGDYDTILTDQNLPRYDIATWIDGDSMEPKFGNHSVVLLKDTQFDYDGAVYAVYVPESNTTYLKRVYRETEGLRLVSYNKKYPDRFIPYEDNPQIVGKAIGNFNPVAV
ncbi:MAG TPA: XRE family transcriptional regulator [Lactovum miscens]|uniref:XRE family transcriptional regulator n=1 Tax=Lactovum miscens TaxID=190387 RepID=UPI002ED953C8